MIEKTDMTLSEVVETLTGFEEQDIERDFGAQIDDLLQLKPTMGMRALAIVVVKRELVAQDINAPGSKAHKHVMGMTLKQIQDFFPDDDGDDETASGLAELGHEQQPETPAGEGGAAG